MKSSCWSGPFSDGATPENDNLALNKTAWWSDLYSDRAYRLVDGDVDTWADSASQDWPYFGLDFENQTILETIGIIGNNNGGGNQYYNK